MGGIWNRPYGPSKGNPSGLSVLADNVSGATPAPLPILQTYNLTAETVLLNPAQPTLAATVSIPSGAGYEQLPFEFNCSGYLTTGASMTVTAKLYAGTSATVGSDTLLKSFGAITQNSLTRPFWIHGKFIYDSVSGLLNGTVDAYFNEAIVASTTLTNFPTGIADSNDPVVSFLVSFTFSVANAGNVVSVPAGGLSVG